MSMGKSSYLILRGHACCRWVYEDNVNQLRNRYSVWEEAELVTGCIHKWHKLQKRKHRDVSDQIEREMGQLWSRLREEFFRSVVPQVGGSLRVSGCSYLWLAGLP
jgi:hypothetical protein